MALAVPLLLARFQRFRVPIVVGEIIAGIIIGKSVLNLVEPSPTLDFLAEFGFAFLMFLSGLEIDFNLLQSRGAGVRRKGWYAQPLPMAVLIFAGTVILALGSAWLLTASD
ncbi:MAG: cation:proton antiporter, partial [Anaerolineales bacterium]|nr:cation:proton antiporter [Anaerolineales bacterium]